MTLHKGPQTETSDTWPPAVECASGSVPNIVPDTRQRELRRGRLALLLALIGIGAPALAIGIVIVILQAGWLRSASIDELFFHLFAPVDAVCLLGLICEVVAAVMGSIARRTRTGRWGQAISMLAMGACSIYALIFYPAAS